MNRKTPRGKKPVRHPATQMTLLGLIQETCKWLNGSYETMPPEITLQINPTDFATRAADLSGEHLITHARTLRGEALRVEGDLSKLNPDAKVVRVANNLKSLLSSIEDELRKARKEGSEGRPTDRRRSR